MSNQPVLFVSHGSPMLALAPPEHPYAASLRGFAGALAARPRAVLVVSAHWLTRAPRLTGAARPETLHDFQGFPDALQAVVYPAPGDPDLAGRVQGLLAALDPAAAVVDRGLDHGAWAVLRHLFPDAQVPVVQASLPAWGPARLLAFGAALRPLREQGVLVLASGGLVHNLQAVDWQAAEGQAEPWALEAEAWLMDRLERGDLEDLLEHRRRWPGGRLAAPTTEHLDPLFVALGAAAPAARPRTLHTGWQLANLSLRCLAWA